VRGRCHHPAAIISTVAFLAWLLVAANAGAIVPPPPLPPQPEGLARDCIIAASLAPDSSKEVDWTVWCGPTPGAYRVELQAPADGPAVSWERSASVAGPGAEGAPRCRASDDEESCALSESGPVTARGSFRVEDDACGTPLTIRIRALATGAAGRFDAQPWGCPGSEPTQPPEPWRAANFYTYKHLRPGSSGRRGVLYRYAQRLDQAWIREAPVERWAAKALGAPTTAAAFEELLLRRQLREQAKREIDRWVSSRGLESIFAGWEWGLEGKVYVGFTAEAESLLARLKAEEPFVAPERVVPFPAPPRYTLTELEELAGRVFGHAREVAGRPDIIEVGYDVVANKVKVPCGEGEGAKTAAFLAEYFPADAPFEIVEVQPAPP
jgi:hypothetical protein